MKESKLHMVADCNMARERDTDKATSITSREVWQRMAKGFSGGGARMSQKGSGEQSTSAKVKALNSQSLFPFSLSHKDIFTSNWYSFLLAAVNRWLSTRSYEICVSWASTIVAGRTNLLNSLRRVMLKTKQSWSTVTMTVIRHSAASSCFFRFVCTLHNQGTIVRHSSDIAKPYKCCCCCSNENNLTTLYIC